MNFAESANKTLISANKDLTRRLEDTRNDAEHTSDVLRISRDERGRMLDDIAKFRRNLNEARAAIGRNKVALEEMIVL